MSWGRPAEQSHYTEAEVTVLTQPQTEVCLTHAQALSQSQNNCLITRDSYILEGLT